MSVVGILPNPASGKDIRRLVAAGASVDNLEKVKIVRRVLAGLAATGVEQVLLMPDWFDIGRRALEGLRLPFPVTVLEMPLSFTQEDTALAARLMRERRARCLVTVGGDGTNRAAAKESGDVPLLPISTGTNNVFPLMLEGTVAGAAAGLIATGAVALVEVATQAKRIALTVEDEGDDLALIDAALVAGAFAGTRAIWDVAGLRRIVLARAEPAAVGLSAIGGLLEPIGAADEGGLEIELCGAGADAAALHTLAPIAPGRYEPIALRRLRRLAPGEPVEMCGPGLLALDGERERRLKPGQPATARVLRDGPLVVDVARTLRLAARRGRFRLQAVQADAPGHQPDALARAAPRT